MYKTYKKDLDYSYVEGIFPSLELIETRPDLVKEVLISSKYDKIDKLSQDLDRRKIPYKIDDKSIKRITRRDNSYLVGVFNKRREEPGHGPHIVLDRPSNMGNLGTIIRTMVGMGYKDLIITGKSCDYFDPKVVRASMGAFFKVNIKEVESIGAYKKAYPNKDLYLFMLGEKTLMDVKDAKDYALCFGNEGEGIDEENKAYGRAIMIPQTDEVDSLNLPISTSIAMFYFSQIIK